MIAASNHWCYNDIPITRMIFITKYMKRKLEHTTICFISSQAKSSGVVLLIIMMQHYRNVIQGRFSLSLDVRQRDVGALLNILSAFLFPFSQVPVSCTGQTLDSVRSILDILRPSPWQRHGMETLSVLLAHFDAAIIQSFDIFFVVSMGKLLTKQSDGEWNETPFLRLLCLEVLTTYRRLITRLQ